ncbi:PTS fructose transporter subunit IIB [Metabacillus arenae]|uniref:PTS fructose transporter subunit IIB n=1 Tax=Metabacillus arenae TaxID=2771434 RepID=A0A926S3H1_9BACI|nr:fructose PTS transporter subunit IIB [Metabacillus arenae]MBD1382954.1 PTS fructose transporter subunit IIB [Metabacillus arenae]
MKIVGVAACTAGIAHTYLAKEKLIKGAQSLGHNIRVETQGTIGVEEELTAQEIKEADLVIIAADVNITGKERFDHKTVVKIPTHVAIKSSKALIKKAEAQMKQNQ